MPLLDVLGKQCASKGLRQKKEHCFEDEAVALGEEGMNSQSARRSGRE